MSSYTPGTHRSKRRSDRASPSRESAQSQEVKRRRERWPEKLAVEQEVIEPEKVKENSEAFRCIGEEVTEMLDYPTISR